MKKVIWGLLVIVMILSLCACSNNKITGEGRQYVGLWKGIDLKVEISFDIRDDGTVIYHSPNGNFRGQWTVAENGIEITIPFEGTQYVVEGHWALEAINGGFSYHYLPDNAEELIAQGDFVKRFEFCGWPYKKDSGDISTLTAYFSQE